MEICVISESSKFAGASDSEIIEYLKSANAVMNAVLDDLSLMISSGHLSKSLKR
jgi:hypothetical protein